MATDSQILEAGVASKPRWTNGNARANSNTSKSWRGQATLPRYLRESLLDPSDGSNISASQRPGVAIGERTRKCLARVSAKAWSVLVQLTDRGNASLVVMLLILATGLVMRFNLFQSNKSTCSSDGYSRLACYFLSAGLFGFMGGFTNWLAVAMLFTKVPFLYGSGVVPARFKEIRVRLRKEMVTSVFDGRHFIRYVNQRTRTAVASADVPQQIAKFLSNPEVDSILQRRLNEFRDEPVGQLLASVGVKADDQSTVKPAIIGASADLAPAVLTALGQLNKTPVHLFRRELDAFITQRAENLDQETVTRMLKAVLRPHLGWIILWGSFFGMVMGIIVQAVNIAPQY
ncbi:uncharacterized protein LOC135815332 [Sycon ciliatum]|uniref:uncharacterized protein LOC135815332 n=1 Tax=Sycon ciliatum TaxID=27933 RepID=UPI0031F688AB